MSFLRRIRMHIVVSDFVWVILFAWLAVDRHPAWWLAVGITIAGWFVDPKYREIRLFPWGEEK